MAAGSPVLPCPPKVAPGNRGGRAPKGAPCGPPPSPAKPLRTLRVPAGALSAESASPFGAPPRRFWASGPCFRGRTADSSPALARGFRPARPSLVQPWNGQPHVVGTDGDPTPPGPVCARHRRGRRHPRSANRTPPEGALSERGRCAPYVKLGGRQIRTVRLQGPSTVPLPLERT